jgi:acyl-CoA synthetase (AMP-forming)/AMP-acid ligase II
MSESVHLAEKIFQPWEIEKTLATHPAIRECAVVGIPHGDRETLAAFVVTHEGQRLSPEALTGFLGQALPAELVPKKIVFLDSLPKNPNGKVLRRQLRERKKETVKA